VSGITYDAGALIAAERGSTELWALHRRMLDRGVRPTVPSLALAQAWRSGRQARLARLLRGCEVAAFAEREARAAGEALAASGTDDVVDAGVVVSAVARADAIATSDPDDITRIAMALGRRPPIHVV